MKIEKNKSKKSIGDLPQITQELIHHLLICSEESLVSELTGISVWRYGKCELYHWIDVLDRFDALLANVTQHDTSSKSFFMCSKLSDPQVKKHILAILNFTALLIEHSYARHIYNSTEHLCTLLASPDLDVVLSVLNLLYVFGKRSNFISRLPVQQRNNLNSYLEFLGETWGGEKNGFGLAQCCRDITIDKFPSTATSVYFEYQPTDNEVDLEQSIVYGSKSIVMKNVDKLSDSLPDVMSQLTQAHNIPLVQQMRLMTRLRLAKNFNSLQHRIRCVLVRLQAISVLVYSMAPAEVVDPLIYDGLVEELIDVLEMKEPYVQEVRAAVLRTLTAIIHLERDPRLGVIIEVTGATTYHGFLPTLVRDCVAAITRAGPDGVSLNYPLNFATALFSFLYHLATYEASGDALVNSGVMESLLQVLDWRAIQPMNITLVTRAVRVVDLITNLDMTAFHSLGGWDKMLERLKMEVDECRKDAPNILPVVIKTVNTASQSVPMETDAPPTSVIVPFDNSTDAGGSEIIQCMPERSALIKSILNFLKKAIPDPTFTENIRNFVDSSLPSSLAHVTSNAEYYGPSIYLPATEVTTTFIFHDPSQLSALQDNGLPWIVLNSLINKKIPVTREVLSALPSILSALCLNTRGLQTFIDAEPFDHLFGVLISLEYLPAMRRKRGNESMGDTAANLGAAMDELMRHQPLLRASVMSALIKLLEKLCKMGKTLNQQLHVDEVTVPNSNQVPLKPPLVEGMTSDDEDDDGMGSHLSDEKEEDEVAEKLRKKKNTPLPLTEYTQNVVHFVDSILSNNSTDDHIKEFVTRGGLPPLLSLFSLPALPLNFPSSVACNSITSACKAILNCAHEGKLLEEALLQLSQVLQDLQPFIDSPEQAKESMLLREINSCPSPDNSPLLHNLTAAGGYIQLFIHLAKCGQIESRQLCVKHWASSAGQAVLTQLSALYRALVWEGFIVLAIASERDKDEGTTKKEVDEMAPKMESTTSPQPKPPPTDEVKSKEGPGESKAFIQALKSFTPPLAVTSRVGRSLAELMSLLVRLCTGPLQRPPRRGPGMGAVPYYPPSEDAISVCTKVTDLLLESLTWDVPIPGDVHNITDVDVKEWLFSGMTFKMYAVDFCLLLLFDEHKQAFHLMLHSFSKKNVMDAFIRSFHAAVDCVNDVHGQSRLFIADYAVTSDFLEAWLNLAEKLIDATSILDSTHLLPIPPPSQTGGKKLMFNPLFNPLEFVINAQKAILPCVQKLCKPENITWVMPEVVQHLMATIRHFYSSEKIIEIKLAEFKGEEVKPRGAVGTASGTTSSVSSLSAPYLPRVDPLYLQQLMDMGFSRDHAEEALLNSGGNLSAAMDWILIHPRIHVHSSSSNPLSEDEELAQAIALSLGQNLQSSQSTDDKTDTKTEGEDTEDLSPLSGITLDHFSDELLKMVLEVVPLIRDTVYRACDLLVALSKRNGPQWRDIAVRNVKEKACLCMQDLVEKISNDNYKIKGGVIDSSAFYICLLALVMEEMPLSCSSITCQPDLLESSINLLRVSQQKLSVMKKEEHSRQNPMWMAPLLLIMELWLGIENLVKWNKPPAKGHQAIWLWFENMNSRWCCYTGDINKNVETAYRDGEPVARVVSGRQRYTIQFSSMTQVNVETGTHRPVMRLEVPKKKEGKQENVTEKDNENDMQTNFEVPPEFCRFTDEQAASVVTCCTYLLSAEIDPDTLHADMRLLLSLTRNPELSKIFMKERGPHALLVLTQRSSFQGFSSLSSLLLRHVLEDGPLLEQCMENIFRGVISGGINDSKEVKAHGPGRRDLDYVLRRLAPCVCRDKDLFLRTTSQVLRLTNLPPPLEDYLSHPRIQPAILKCTPATKKDSIPLTLIQQNLLMLLIDHLCADAFLEDGLTGKDSTPVTKIDEDTSESSAVPRIRYSLQVTRTRRGSYRRQITDNDDDDDFRSEDMTLDSEPVLETGQTSSRAGETSTVDKSTSEEIGDTNKEDDKTKNHCPLLSQAAILRLLAELIESYPACARTIIESSRNIKIHRKSSQQVTKEISILAFILDHLLPASYIQGSSATQVAKLAKVFLQCLATTALPTDALNIFVSEFRAGFSRALMLPESQLKHQRIRALSGLLGQIVEPQTGFSSRSNINPSQFVRMLIRKGFITDLSKAIHNLDLSSPLLTATINSILKPLECLTKIVTQFLAAQKRGQTLRVNPNPVSTNSHSSDRAQEREDVPPESVNNVNTNESVDMGQERVESGLETTSSEMLTNQSINDSTLATPDISLIPLHEEDEEMTEPHDNDNEENVENEVEDLMVQEAISIAHELGRRCRQVTSDVIAGNDGEEDMDIQEIVDEILDREPGSRGIGPGALLEEDGHHVTSGSELTDEDSEECEEPDADNYNSAGEEIEEEEFDESQNQRFSLQGRGRYQLPQDQDEDHDDTSDSQISTDVVEEDDNPSDNEDHSTDLSDEEEEESMVLDLEEDEVLEDRENVTGQDEEEAVEEGGDDTFDIEADDEEEEEDEEDEEEGEEGLELDYENLDLYDGDLPEYVHIDFPPWGFGLRDDPMDVHYLGGFPSLLSRAYHIRSHTGNTMDNVYTAHSLPSLPQHHPLLVRYADHPRHQLNQDHVSLPGGNTPADIQRSNIVQQLLTNISTSVGTDEVLSFNVGGSNPRQTSSVRVPEPESYNVSLSGGGEDLAESTGIPDNLSRWREESTAIDGHTAFLCISAIRSLVVKQLKTLFEEEQVGKKNVEESKKPKTVTSGETSRGQVISAPNPSDEATPSTATPRNDSSSVEQLQSSLRAVADALAQTVTDVRETRSTIENSSSQEESGPLEGREENQEETSTEEMAHLPSNNTPSVTSSQDTPISHSVVGMPDLSTFDGSQDSARAILSQISPNDPLYTFLSAVARAPTPPLPESTSEPTSLSPARVPPSTSSPRLPVFTQMQPTDILTSPNTIQVSVIQNPRPQDQSQSLPSLTVSSIDVNNLATRVSNFLTQMHQSDSQSSQTHSHSQSQHQSLESIPSRGSQSLLAANNLADALATELARAVSDHLTPITTPTITSSTTSTLPPPPSQSTSTSVPTSSLTSQTTGSPSPSDTLAPMLSSLQMPNPQVSDDPHHVSHDPSHVTYEDVYVGERIDAFARFNFSSPVNTSQSVTATSQTSQTSSTTLTNTNQTISSTSQTSTTIAQTSSSTSQTGLSSNSQDSTATGDFPEGIDPTFLAALPDAIRQEVLGQYEREQRQQQTGSATAVVPSSSVTTINPEVLAALPPEIQEEVLQQERIEQARRISTDPSQQMDATSFLTSLTPDLRRTILSDMDDTQLNQLPEEVALEARTLRQERESRHRHYLAQQMQSRYEHMLEAPQSGPTWTHMLNHDTTGGAGSHYRYAVFNLNPQILERVGHDRFSSLIPSSLTHPLFQRDGDLGDKQILDQDGLSCLIVLLFLDQTKLHFNRLFRIFRSLSQHLPSRSWLIASLLSILKETSNTSPSHTCPHPQTSTGGRNTSDTITQSLVSSNNHWLNMTISAALGSHASVFEFTSSGGKVPHTDIYIHPHAGTTICNNVLELLIFLARQFPSSFLPSELMPKDSKGAESNQSLNVLSNFWQILMKLDAASSRKGKGSAKIFQYQEPVQNMTEADLFISSSIGAMMQLFDHPVIQNSVTLVDKLLRVLSVVSGAIPKQGLSHTNKEPKKETEDSTTKHVSSKDEVKINTIAGPSTTESPLAPKCYLSSVVSISLLKPAIGVLTSGKCTEDCLDDVTNLLINLSRCSVSTREAILLVLLEGVRTIGGVLCNQISVLLNELSENMAFLVNRQSSINSNEEASDSTDTNESASVPSLGTTEGVVLPTLQGRGILVDHSNDLHLPCMGPLICKVSQQSFFLRLLKVVCQLRESAQSAVNQAQTRIEAATPPGSLGDSVSLLLAPTPTITTPENQESSRVNNRNENEAGEEQERPLSQGDVPMEDQPSNTSNQEMDTKDDNKHGFVIPSLSMQLELEELWTTLSDCLDALAGTYDPHAVLVLQSTVEAFFLVHADQNEEVRSAGRERRSQSRQHQRRLPSFHTISDTESSIGSPAPFEVYSPVPGTPSAGDIDSNDPYAHLPPDTARFLKFAERHRTVLNQILRQSTIPLSEGPFAVLVNHTRLLDFDVKRRYFRQELEQLDEGLRREDLVIHIRRDSVFEDSYRELYRRSPEEMKANLYVTFDGEEGQDAGGLLREWYLIIAREMFNPNYALFKTTPGDRVTYMPNPSSHINPEHLTYFKFVGRIIAKAIYDNKLLDCYFTRSFYKHILSKPVRYTDMESEDYSFYQGMVYLLDHDINEVGIELTFTTEIEEFGKTELRDLKPKGREIPVTEGNKREYVQLACQMKMTGSVRSQIKGFLEGFYEVIPKNLISIFNEQELELLISGLPTVDIDDLKANTEYHKYTESSLQIQWFWRALRSYDQADRARFLQFVTGTSKVPLQGFVALEGMNGIQKFQIHRDDRSTERLPSAHTCFNQLDLPPYETYDKLNQMLLIAIRECPEGFGFA